MDRVEKDPTLSGSTAATPVLTQAPWFSPPEDWAEQHPILSPNAKLETHWLQLADREHASGPGDGGGRAWLRAVLPPSEAGAPNRNPETAGETPRVEAGSRHRFEVEFEVGVHGIEEGGLLFLMPEAFWDWSEAQTWDPNAPGYTTAIGPDADVRLVPEPGGAVFRVEGRALLAGERLHFVFGAGPSGAQVDRYAERGAEIMVGVDADGDGFRRWIPETARLDVLARAGTRLIAHGPADTAPNASFEIVLALTDSIGNHAPWPMRADPAGSDPGPSAFDVEVLDASTLAIEDPGLRSISVGQNRYAPYRVNVTPRPGEGTIRLRFRGRGALRDFQVDLPPIVVRDAQTRLVWGDLHGHSQLSDGTGTPEDYFRYARDVARLDVAALTDHDHWGARPLDERPEVTSRLFDTIDRAQEPGRFITLPGYEWTNWLHGHRHVLYFEEPGGPRSVMYSSLDPETDRPDELWAALRGRQALTFAHHSAGEPVATNWAYAPDPVLEPVTEIVSVHGQSESPDMPAAVAGAIPGYFVLDTLLAGYQLGFIGSGDSHDGHPGLAQFTSGRAGLAGLFTTALDRAHILETLRSRRTFATNGIRPWMQVSIDGVPMGGSLAPGEPGSEATLMIHYEATAPIERIEIVRSGRTATLELAPGLSQHIERQIPPLADGEFHYVRVIQSDGGLAWSSPIFVEARTAP